MKKWQLTLYGGRTVVVEAEHISGALIKSFVEGTSDIESVYMIKQIPHHARVEDDIDLPIRPEVSG